MKGEQIIRSQFHNNTSIELNVSMLTKGVYLVKIQTGAGLENKKISHSVTG